MTIYRGNLLNTTALATPGLYINVIAPSIINLNGVPTNVGGFVGIASWGPVNSPIDVGSITDFQVKCGNPMARTYDIGTHIMAATWQGNAGVYKVVRVTDGTDTKASATVGTIDGVFSSLFTGIGGNGTTVTLYAGQATGTFRAVVNRPGNMPETFANIGGTGNAFWLNLAAAINNGQNSLSGPSNHVTFAPGAGTDAPIVGTVYTLAGGTDGATTITDTIVMGTDGATRTGMYALRGTPVSVAALCDVTTESTFANQVTFGSAEGIYMVGVGAVGQSISTAVSLLQTGGISDPAFVYILGDWPVVEDNVLGTIRVISPQPFKVGVLVNLNPSESSLNKPIQGIVSTTRLEAGLPYSDADLQSLSLANIDVLTNPIPTGNVFGFRIGRNSSQNPVIHGDNYTRMTNYLAATFEKGLGWAVGRKNTPNLRQDVTTILDAFLQNLYENEMIADWDVIYDARMNPQSQIALGYLVMTVQVQYLSIVEYFVLNVQGGQSVQVTVSQAAKLLAA
jgi:hypothetical protein